MSAKNELIGKFFHTFHENGNIRYQGRVTAEPVPGYFLVQLFDWLLGSPSNKELAPIAQMIGWSFYDDADDWREAGDQKAEEARLARSLERDEVEKGRNV